MNFFSDPDPTFPIDLDPAWIFLIVLK
jgi:hypothetical protein